jgi:hypothetical protein
VVAVSLTLNLGFRILGALMASRSFLESFVVKAFRKDLGRIFSLLMFANPQAVFVILFVLCSTS